MTGKAKNPQPIVTLNIKPVKLAELTPTQLQKWRKLWVRLLAECRTGQAGSEGRK